MFINNCLSEIQMIFYTVKSVCLLSVSADKAYFQVHVNSNTVSDLNNATSLIKTPTDKYNFFVHSAIY